MTGVFVRRGKEIQGENNKTMEAEIGTSRMASNAKSQEKGMEWILE